MASKYATPEEAHEARREAGRKGAAACIASGHKYSGGRPKGAKNKKQNPGGPIHTIQVREDAWKIFTTLARASNTSMTKFMGTLAQAMKAKNAHIFNSPNEVII